MARLLVDGVRLHVATSGDGAPLVLLHGFTGCGAAWAAHVRAFATRFRVVTIDLLGHGWSDAPADPRRYHIERSAADVLAVLDRLGIERAYLLGYSMGGRLALQIAATGQERILALIMVSASPGLRSDAERRSRATQDAALADAIEREGVPAFVDRWERQPIFASQARLPWAVRETLRAQRLQHTARGLANSLRGMGQGVQPPLYDQLPRLRIPTLLLAGELDARYCAVGAEMSAAIPGARMIIVPDSGHAVQLEQPEVFRQCVLEFLDTVTAGHGVR
jgi:2-succinyl-6-hydroxy-2,4-cyclohexadiene-1-carboxylate synthase